MDGELPTDGFQTEKPIFSGDDLFIFQDDYIPPVTQITDLTLWSPIVTTTNTLSDFTYALQWDLSTGIDSFPSLESMSDIWLAYDLPYTLGDDSGRFRRFSSIRDDSIGRGGLVGDAAMFVIGGPIAIGGATVGEIGSAAGAGAEYIGAGIRAGAAYAADGLAYATRSVAAALNYFWPANAMAWADTSDASLPNQAPYTDVNFTYDPQLLDNLNSPALNWSAQTGGFDFENTDSFNFDDASPYADESVYWNFYYDYNNFDYTLDYSSIDWSLFDYPSFDLQSYDFYYDYSLDNNYYAGDPYAGAYAPVILDLGGDGYRHRTAWAGAGDGVLVLDLDGDGKIDQQKEVVFTAWDPTAATDFEALRDVFDANHDGKLNAGDLHWDDFRIMVTNADGTTSLKTLAELGIALIELTSDNKGATLEDGSRIIGQAAFTRTDGTTGQAADVLLLSESQGYALRTAIAHNADGLSKTISTDADGDGVIDLIQTDVTVVNAGGGRTQTLTNQNGGGIVLDLTVTAASADGHNITIQRDFDGDGAFEQVEVRATAADGEYTVSVTDLNPDGSLRQSGSSTTSADGYADRSTQTVTQANGDVAVSDRLLAGDGSLVSSLSTTTSGGSAGNELWFAPDAGERLLYGLPRRRPHGLRGGWRARRRPAASRRSTFRAGANTSGVPALPGRIRASDFGPFRNDSRTPPGYELKMQKNIVYSGIGRAIEA
jgi:hypothetical protein